MKTPLIFATNNAHKLEEVRQMLGDSYRVLSLEDIECRVDIPETGDTLEENALLKARFISNLHHCDCFADDSGLEVTALNNAPGVHSARYAGASEDPVANRKKLLQALVPHANRSARFRTQIALIQKDKEYLFEGIIEGSLLREERGNGGFGYDSLFVPQGYTQTFAELGAEIKNAISHRAEAIRRLKQFLDEKN
jgi:XTP/dITP diphosphohydrolase